MKNLLLYAILTCITSVMPIYVKAAEAYAAFSNDNTTLTFYYDNEKSTRNGMDIGPFEMAKDRGWHNYCETITTIVIDNSFNQFYNLTSTSLWFEYFRNLIEIRGIGNLKTSNVTDMSGMFDECFSLLSLDLSNFDTRNVKDMQGMFAGCKKLTSLDLSNFNTENVTNMRSMFEGCEILKILNISNFNTTKVERLTDMFEKCYALTEVDLSSFETSSVIKMDRMFNGSNALAKIYVSSKWTIAKVEDGDRMFDGCISLVGGSGTVWDENHTDYTYAHIDGGPSNPGYLTFKNAGEQTGEQTDKKCATPTIAFVDGKLTFSCETEDVEFTYEVTNTDVKKGNGNEVTIGGTYKVSVYATKAGYDDSDVATLEFTLGAGGKVCDVNKDGAVDVADIATIISKMASGARMQEETEE